MSAGDAAFAEPIIELLTDDARRAEMARKSLERCRVEIGSSVRRLQEYYAAFAPPRTR